MKVKMSVLVLSTLIYAATATAEEPKWYVGVAGGATTVNDFALSAGLQYRF